MEINKVCKDCGIKIYRTDAIRCPSCSKLGKRNGRYTTGNRSKQHYCQDCNKKITSDAKRCTSCARIKEYKNPKNNPNYIHGLDKFQYPSSFKLIKSQIRERDKYECQNCYITEEEYLLIIGKVLDVHHIDYNKFNCKLTNLITLCNSCNLQANGNRDYWYAYYTYIIEEIYGT
jgi:5-methylcytosine-specific restriction endonuclease McrA